MGFLDKVKGAAASAKQELDKSGLVDKAKDKAREQWHAGTDGDEPPAPTSDHTTHMVDAIRRGAVDPTTLISQTEVAAIAGDEVTPGRTYCEEQWVSAEFQMKVKRGTQRFTLSVCHAIDDEFPWNADEFWDYVRETYGDEAVTVPNLGDEAFRINDHIWSRAAGRVIFADVSGDGLDEAAAVFRAEAMVRLALPRLPPLIP